MIFDEADHLEVRKIGKIQRQSSYQTITPCAKYKGRQLIVDTSVVMKSYMIKWKFKWQAEVDRSRKKIDAKEYLLQSPTELDFINIIKRARDFKP